jgi:hypothetical protein
MSQSEAPAAAEIANSVSDCMNLLFLFAAPRVFGSIQRSGLPGLDDKTAGATLRRFLRNAVSIRARMTRGAPATPATNDVERLVRAAMIVEEIAGELGVVRLAEDLPPAIIERSRRALDVLGFPEPKGGWDDFDGFLMPYPPPPKP